MYFFSQITYRKKITFFTIRIGKKNTVSRSHPADGSLSDYCASRCLQNLVNVSQPVSSGIVLLKTAPRGRGAPKAKASSIVSNLQFQSDPLAPRFGQKQFRSFSGAQAPRVGLTG